MAELLRIFKLIFPIVCGILSSGGGSMRQTVLYIAMSLDGYIADRNGGVEWLTGQDGGADAGDSYTEFTKEIDTVVMGWDTYHQVTTELAPGEWVYEDFTSYIFTHRELDSTEKIRFVKESPGELIRSLKQQDGKDIWICGGADIVQQLMREDLIDRFHISVIPVILGDGIRLFGTMEKDVKLRLVKTESYNGISELIYEKQ